MRPDTAVIAVIAKHADPDRGRPVKHCRCFHPPGQARPVTVTIEGPDTTVICRHCSLPVRLNPDDLYADALDLTMTLVQTEETFWYDLEPDKEHR